MKIKGIFVIPLIAILVAIFSLGVVPGMASDTTATEESDTLTFVPYPTEATTNMDQMIEGFVSDFIGEDLEEAEGPIRGFSELMENILNSIRNVLNAIIRIFQVGGGMMGGLGSGEGGSLLGGLGM